MSHFDIVKQSKISQSYKAAKVKGMFDIVTDEIKESFKGDIDLDGDWQIGAIIGSSGSGKTTIATQVFGEFEDPQFIEPSVIDDMPGSVEDIVKMFNSVGFSSPPSWLKPYNVLSNGEQMRVRLAHALLSDDRLIVFDEYTSVVDRTVAKIGSLAVNKAIKRSDKQFIAIACHEDILEWLQPDWVFYTDSMTYEKKNTQNLQLQSTSFSKKDYGIFLANIII